MSINRTASSVVRHSIASTLFVCLSLCGFTQTQVLAGAPEKQAESQSGGEKQETKTLVPIKTKQAKYPAKAREKGIQGQVIVKMTVSETGDVKSAEAVTGDPTLANAAVTAARQWKFKPFIKDGKPIIVETSVPFDFYFKSNEIRPFVAAKSGQTLLLIHSVLPEYPREAYKAHIKGKVVLHAIVDKNGRVTNLTAVAGPEILLPAALAAVQQWRYRPYMVNGEPVEVDTDITLDFPLTR